MKVSKNLRRAAAIVALLALSVAPAVAQRGKWWQDDRFRRDLGLTPEQSTRLEEIFQKTQPTLRQRMQALDQAEKEFDRLVETGDDASVLDHVEIMQAARAELNKTRTMMLDRKSTHLNTSHGYISYAVFCLKKKTKKNASTPD